ncbi:MAG: 4Fe-4S binding protein [Thermodesulfovibrionia bacterium]|nr:4Fe-4S binding protein [Thermodesulfovibrionia bacterium]
MNRYMLKFTPDVLDSPIIANTILKTGIPINILRANVDYNEGTIIINILGDKKEQQRVVKAFTEEGLEVTQLEKNVVKADGCVDCGACIALCPVSAISFDKEWSIDIDGKK